MYLGVYDMTISFSLWYNQIVFSINGNPNEPATPNRWSHGETVICMGTPWGNEVTEVTPI